VWLGDGPTLPAGTQPLRLLGDVVMALAAAATRRRPAEVDAKVDDADDEGVDAEVDAEVDDLVDDELEVEVDVEHWRSAVQAAQQGRAWLGVDGGGVLVVIANDGIPS
jgi:L-aminopeptidase/D-esterase-like protein